MEAFFLPSGSGQRFCLHHAPPAGPIRAVVVYVHPWADEMNKSRRMAALQSRAMAALGYAVLQIDLHGCGDSSGDFVQARWQDWVDDVLLAAHWLQQRYDAPLCLWGLRAGALLATQAAQQSGLSCQLLLWQPVVSGKQLLRQFLRLRAAAELGQSDAKGVLQQLHNDLAEGTSVDVAGYRLSAALANGLEAAQWQWPQSSTHIAWLEVSSKEGAALPPASATQVQAARARGLTLSTRVVTGPAFWQTQEIEDAPDLLSASLAALQAMHTAPAP